MILLHPVHAGPSILFILYKKIKKGKKRKEGKKKKVIIKKKEGQNVNCNTAF